MNFKYFFSKFWPLITIIVIGGALRFYGLLQNPISLFSDEVDMGYQAYSLTKTGCDYSGFCLPVQFHSFSDVQPPIPIYFIALLGFLGIKLELAIRMVSAIFGTLGIVVTYLLLENFASKKIYNLELKGLGLIGSALLAVTPWHLTYSRIGFSLALLYFFVVTGFYFFTEFLIKQKNIYFYLSILFLGLSPMVYNTAKMAIIFYPFLLLLVPNSINLLKHNTKAKLFSTFLIIPLLIMFIGGNTSARFNYISIFTDPTAGAEVNLQRLKDSGLNAGVGTVTSVFSKVFHNKPVFFIQNLTNNYFGLISTDFLFSNGDPNERHSPKNWGMVYRSMFLLLLLGCFFLIKNKHGKLLLFLIIFSFISLSTSAITREGGSHASRSFMFLLPIIIISAIGMSYIVNNFKKISSLLVLFILIESVFFIHNYWFHYRFESENSWSSGMKELIESTKKYPNQPIIISPKNENPLIFYAFYNRFDPKKFQQFVKTNTLYNSLNGKYNLDGNRIGDTNLYIASLIDYKNTKRDTLPNAVFYLTKLETINTDIRSSASNSDIIKLPSGEPLYYEFKY